MSGDILIYTPDLTFLLVKIPPNLIYVMKNIKSIYSQHFYQFFTRPNCQSHTRKGWVRGS
jgi:hypothetical protein